MLGYYIWNDLFFKLINLLKEIIVESESFNEIKKSSNIISINKSDSILPCYYILVVFKHSAYLYSREGFYSFVFHIMILIVHGSHSRFL